MHTNTPTNRLLAHRHLVAFPLFLFALAFSLSPLVRQQVPLQGAILSAAGEDTPFLTPDGAYGVLFSGGEMMEVQDGMQLRQGSVLLGGEGLVTAYVGDLRAVTLRGAMHVSLQDDRLEVVAVSAPVVIERDQNLLLLPAGSRGEWSVPELSIAFAPEAFADALGAAEPLPQDILAEELSALARAPHPQAPSLPVLPEPDLRLSPERLRTRHAARDILEAMATGDFDEATRVLAEHRVGLAADPSLGEALLRAVIARTDTPPSLQAAVLPLVIHRADLTLLSRMDPLLRDAAWVTPSSASSPAGLAGILAFPASDVLPDAASDLASGRWHADAEAAVAASDAPEILVPLLLRAMEPARQAYLDRGYPDRLMRRWEALQALAAPVADRLDGDALAALSRWSDAVSFPAEDLPAPELEPEVSAEPPAPVEPAPPADPAAMEAEMLERLRVAGALMGLSTEIKAVEADAVTVSGVLFSSPDGDHAYDFTFHPVEGTASAIRRDGTETALPLPWDDFVRWARGE